MYQNRRPILMTSGPEIVRSLYGVLPCNGTYVRTERGVCVGKTRQWNGGIHYCGEWYGKRFYGTVTDRRIVERFSRYMEQYYSTHFTNCATLANYLFSGTFVEAETLSRQFLLRHHMRTLTHDDDFRIGDMLCVMYANMELFCSRKRSCYRAMRRLQKRSHNTGELPRSREQVVFSPAELIELGGSAAVTDYHFMTCVDTLGPRPVWLSQAGYCKAGDDIAFFLSPGLTNIYHHLVPTATFIKRRR